MQNKKWQAIQLRHHLSVLLRRKLVESKHVKHNIFCQDYTCKCLKKSHTVGRFTLQNVGENDTLGTKDIIIQKQFCQIHWFVHNSSEAMSNTCKKSYHTLHNLLI